MRRMKDSIQSDSRRGRNGDGNGEAERLSLLSFLRALKSGGGSGAAFLWRIPATGNESSVCNSIPEADESTKIAIKRIRNISGEEGIEGIGREDWTGGGIRNLSRQRGSYSK